MILKNLSLTDFKSYKEGSFSFDPRINLICGDNAQGKTNLLESIFYLSSLRSFRPLKDKEIVRIGEKAARIEADIEALDDTYTIMIQIRPPERRQMFVNGVKLTKASEIVSLVTTVLFCPDDLSLIRESGARRRRFLNMALCQLRPRYLALLSEYNKVLEHKQAILKQAAQHPGLLSALDTFNERLAAAGAPLIVYRAKFAEALQKEASLIHKEIAPAEELSLQYQTVRGLKDPLSMSEEDVYSHLLLCAAEYREAEIAVRAALFGVQKDDILLMINGLFTRQYASQGQARSAALALKLGEREVFYKESGQYPILLLDDVLSELDDARRDYVLNKIDKGQVLITSCNKIDMKKIQAGKVFAIKKQQE